MQFEHEIAQWEKNWGRLKFRNLSLLKSLESKKFTMFIGTIPYYDRVFDKQRRIWIGQNAFRDFNPGDMVIIELKDDALYVRKKNLAQNLKT